MNKSPESSSTMNTGHILECDADSSSVYLVDDKADDNKLLDYIKDKLTDDKVMVLMREISQMFVKRVVKSAIKPAIVIWLVYAVFVFGLTFAACAVALRVFGGGRRG